MCCFHHSSFYRCLPCHHAIILFIEFVLGLGRIIVFFSPPSSTDSLSSIESTAMSTSAMGDSRAVAGFILDWISCLAATLLGLLIVLTLLLIGCKIVLTCLTDDNRVGPDDEETEDICSVRSLWRNRAVHRLIALNCNCPCYQTRPRLRFQVRLIYLGVCFLLRLTGISLYTSAANRKVGSGLAAVCGLSIICLAMVFSLELYHYCVWWHYRPSCDTKCSMLSEKHKRYIPYHLSRDNRILELDSGPCPKNQTCPDRTLEHILIYHSRDYKPQERYRNLSETELGNTRYIGFHQTDAEAAVSIAHSDFKISTNPRTTMLGQGVYFARSLDATSGKANNTGAVICAEINMGRVKYVGQEAHNDIYQGTNGWWAEYDTMYYCHDDDNRDEFCVKSPNQILKWVMVVEQGAHEKVEKYGLATEFDDTVCDCI